MREYSDNKIIQSKRELHIILYWLSSQTNVFTLIYFLNLKGEC